MRATSKLVCASTVTTLKSSMLARIRRGVVCRADRRVYLQLADKSYVFDVLSSTEAETALYASGGGSSALRSPMPGVISAVKVSVGDLVA